MPETTQLLPRTPPAPNADTHGGLIGSWLASYPSPNTRASYRVDARLFCEFLDAGRVDLLQVSRAHVDLFARARSTAGDADTTLARRLAAVSAFYTYALTVDAAGKTPAQYVGRPTVDQDHTTTAALTRRKAMRLLDTAVADSPRSHALVDLLLSTGVRISEALTATQAGLSADRLVIRRKGGKKQWSLCLNIRPRLSMD
ncbi:site-specific integrase [Kocuria marina]|uniref:site-specific integrase n=1 Tax=Kocuria marina TaxID=223184 RepID=UPI0011A45AB3|nr:site-specific integrase [Kocuria indica]